MSFADIIANAANLAFLLFLFIVIIRPFIKNKIIQFILMIILAGFLLLSPCFHDMLLIYLIRGVIGDLSISSLLFFLCLGIAYFASVPVNLFDRTFCMIITFIGLALYLSAIDIIPIDIYQTGYLPHSSLVIIFLFCMLFMLINYVFALIWLIALIMFLAGLQNSANVWDYLLDPVLWLLCTYKFAFNHKVNGKID